VIIGTAAATGSKVDTYICNYCPIPVKQRMRDHLATVAIAVDPGS